MVHSCPVCNTALTDKMYDGVAFLECPQCAGIWIYETDLKQLETKNIKDLNQLDIMDVPIKPVESPADVLTCLECGGTMEQFHFMMDTPIMLHRCDACEGLWINHGELTQMEAAIEAANQPPTAEEIAIVKGERPINHPADASKEAAPGTRIESAAEMSFDNEHADTMAKYSTISSICRLLSTRIPWI